MKIEANIWSDQEVSKLKKLVSIHGKKVKEIGKNFPERSYKSIWMKIYKIKSEDC